VFFFPGTDISRTVPPINVKFCVTVELSRHRSSPLLVAISLGHNVLDLSLSKR